MCRCGQSVVVDPCLAMTLPKDATVATGLTALYHSLEVFCNPSAGRDAREFAALGFARAVQSLQGFSGTSEPPMSLTARVQAAEASLYTSAALCRSTAGAARGLALAISGRYSMSYSRALACVAPRVLDTSLDVMEDTEDERAADAASTRLCQLADVFVVACSNPPDLSAAVTDALTSSPQTCEDPRAVSAHIKSLTEYGGSRVSSALVSSVPVVSPDQGCRCSCRRWKTWTSPKLILWFVLLLLFVCEPPCSCSVLPQKIADTADVEENTAGNMVKLTRRDLLDLLK